MTEPTPRPWRVGPTNNNIDEPDEVAILSAEGFCPAVAIPSGAGRDLRPDLTRANAELIVRAVNNHDRLVAALERAVDELTVFIFDHPDPGPDAWAVQHKARAALRAARGDV